LQMVPVGAGQAKALHWDGFQPLWAGWFPDGQHIFLWARNAERSFALYVTDRDGSTPKLFPGIPDRWDGARLMAPDSLHFFQSENGAWVVRLLASDSIQPIPGMQPGEEPIGWASDSKHIFTQLLTPTGLTIGKVDVSSGQREVWQ